MNPDSVLLVLPASVAGGVVGILAFGNRRSRKEGRSRPLRMGVGIAGSAAFGVSLLLFAKAFGADSGLFAMTATALVAAWTGMFHTVVPLGLPASLRKVGDREFASLRRPWTGVRWFGAVLHNTPMRHLGGPVYLARCANDPACVLQGIQEAEVIHLWSMLFCLPWLGFWCLRGWWWSAGLSLAVNTLLNVYPILHLRLTRGRMARYAVKSTHRNRLTGTSGKASV